MLSYGKNAADAVLARVFEDRERGFYVDAGARHPELGSVTKHFYDLGWHGINVAPIPADHAVLCETRPRDVNLRLALSDRVGRGRWYRPDEQNRGRLTLGDGILTHGRDSGAAVALDVELATLAEVCARYAPGPIDFLKIDVDGREDQVIRGGDFSRYRPRVVLVGATEPGSNVPRQAAWEPVLLAAGYHLALFDGVNRFYVRAEDAALMPRLAWRASAHDAPAPHEYLSKIDEMERYVASLESALAERERYAVDVREHFERSQAWVNVLESKVRRFEEYLGLLPGTLPPPRPG